MKRVPLALITTLALVALPVFCLCTFFVAILTWIASPVYAQDGTIRRPYRGLFGGHSNPNRQLDFQWSTVGVYDDNVTADTSSTAAPARRSACA